MSSDYSASQRFGPSQLRRRKIALMYSLESVVKVYLWVQWSGCIWSLLLYTSLCAYQLCQCYHYYQNIIWGGCRKAIWSYPLLSVGQIKPVTHHWLTDLGRVECTHVMSVTAKIISSIVFIIIYDTHVALYMHVQCMYTLHSISWSVHIHAINLYLSEMHYHYTV